jgi:putative DNA primase/helicase
MSASLVHDYPWTDAGNSERLIAEHGQNLRYVPAWETWISWHGSRWEIDKGYPYRMAELVARKMYDEVDDLKPSKGMTAEEHDGLKKAAKAFARKSESAASIESTLKLARYRTGVSVSHEKLDGKPMILPMKNGTVELNTGKVRNPSRDDYATLIIPIRYDAAAKCPTWERFLHRAMGDNRETVQFLQRCVGYSLTGSVAEHVLFFCHGPKGKNGKSTFLSLLRELLGGYGAAAPRKLLFQGIGDRHPTELTTLFGKRVVTCSEVPEDQKFDEALVKDLTGGERISAHRMREDFWEFEPTHKLWLAGNHKPTITGVDGGIWRRIMLIPWEVTIPEKERDLDLVKKLRLELPGILAWAVRGCIAWQKTRLDPPRMVIDATLQYRRESDLLGVFFHQFCRFDPEARMAKSKLRKRYETWCEEVGTMPLGTIRFYRRLRERGCDDTSMRDVDPRRKFSTGAPVDAWSGVRLLTEPEQKAIRKWDPVEL